MTVASAFDITVKSSGYDSLGMALTLLLYAPVIIMVFTVLGKTIDIMI